MGYSRGGVDLGPAGATLVVLFMMVPIGIVIAVLCAFGVLAVTDLRDFGFVLGGLVVLHLIARVVEGTVKEVRESSAVGFDKAGYEHASARYAAQAEWASRLESPQGEPFEADLKARAAALLHSIDEKVGARTERLGFSQAEEHRAVTRMKLCAALADKAGVSPSFTRTLLAEAILRKADIPTKAGKRRIAIERRELPDELEAALPRLSEKDWGALGGTQDMNAILDFSSRYIAELERHKDERKAAVAAITAQREFAASYGDQLDPMEIRLREMRAAWWHEQCKVEKVADLMEQAIETQGPDFAAQAARTSLRKALVAIAAEEEAEADIRGEDRAHVRALEQAKAEARAESEKRQAEKAERRRARVQIARQRVALGLGVAATVGLVPAFVFLAPASSWTAVGLIVVLSCVDILSRLLSIRAVGPRSVLDPGFVCTAVLLVFAGPLPAVAAAVASEGIGWAVERYRPTALFANIASAGWATIVAALLLYALVPGLPGTPVGAGAYLTIAVVAEIMLALNYLITRTIAAGVRDGANLVALFRAEFVSLLPAHLMLIAAGVATIALYTQVQVLALALFAPAALVLPIWIPRLVHRTDRAHLEKASFADLVQDIGQIMGLRSHSLSVLEAAAPSALAATVHVADGYKEEHAITVASRMLRDLTQGGKRAPKVVRVYRDALHAVLCLKERYDGKGPLRWRKDETPLESKVLSATLAFFDAMQIDGLDTMQALAQVERTSETEFDPKVVGAISELCETPNFGLSSDQLERLAQKLPKPDISPATSRLIARLSGVS